MKKYMLLTLWGMFMVTLCSCGNKTVKGVDGKEYSSIQEACRHQDFVAAYDWIDKYDGSEEDKDYVFNAEMLYLTSLGTEEASNRIVFLLAEFQIPGLPVQENKERYTKGKGTYENAKKYVEGVKRFNQRCDNVLDMAIVQNNKFLAYKIIPFYKQDVEYYESYEAGPARQEDLGPYIDDIVFSWKSKESAQAKVKEAFGDEEQVEDNQDEVEETAAAQPATKKITRSKRRR